MLTKFLILEGKSCCKSHHGERNLPKLFVGMYIVFPSKFPFLPNMRYFACDSLCMCKSFARPFSTVAAFFFFGFSLQSLYGMVLLLMS